MKKLIILLLFIPLFVNAQRVIPIDYSVDYRKNLQVRDTAKLDKILFEDGTLQNSAYREDSIARQIHDSIKNISTVETDPIWLNDSSHYISKSQARKDIHDSILTISLIESDPIWISDSSTYLSKTIAGTLYHPRLGLTTLNLSADTIKARGKIKINDSTVIYLPNQSTFQNSLFIGSGGRYISHASSTQGYYNTMVGFLAGYNSTSGYRNTALGYAAVKSNTSGINNTGVGAYALESNLTGNSNNAYGYQALNSNTTGLFNTANGVSSMNKNTTGARSCAFGQSAGFNGNLDTCILIGVNAGFGVTNKGLTQHNQIKIGFAAGYADTSNYTLYIDNSKSTDYLTPLIGGRFDLNRVSINKLMPACGDSTLNVGGGIDARGLKLSTNASINKLKTVQISAALTDGTPTDTEIDTATGLTPATAGAGWQCTIKDNNGSGLLYKIESDGSGWYFTVMTLAL